MENESSKNDEEIFLEEIPFKHLESMATEKKPEEHTCKKYFVEFSSNTSLHGIKYTGQFDKPLIVRIFWITAMIISFFICFHLIFKLWVKWEQSPVIVSFTEAPTPIWQIPFPAITLCPGVPFSMDLFNYTQVCNTPEKITDIGLGIYDVIASKCTVNYLNRTTEYVSEEVVKNLASVSKRVDHVLLSCFSYQIGQCNDWFTHILTDSGICYTFNMLNSKEIYSKGVQRDLKFHLNHKRMSKGWSPETMYKNVVEMQTYPFRSMGSGQSKGLVLMLKAPKNETNNRCNSVVKGFELYLHTPDVLPQLNEDLNWIPLNSYSVIAIKPQMITTSENLENYAPEKRYCYFSNERKLKYFNTYNRENCLLECSANYTKAICGCVSMGMPRDNSTLICAIGKTDCIQNASGILMMNELSELSTSKENTEYNILENMKLPKCNCLPSCTSISYEKETSHIPLKFDQIYSMVENYGASTEFIEDMKNYEWSMVHLYFDKPEFTTLKKSELYGVIDFLANCGGLLGVCLGFSVLTLVEIFYFFFVRVSFNVLGKNKYKSARAPSQ